MGLKLLTIFSTGSFEHATGPGRREMRLLSIPEAIRHCERSIEWAEEDGDDDEVDGDGGEFVMV